MPTPSCWPFLVALSVYNRTYKGDVILNIEGKYGHLNPTEITATGLSSPVLLADIDTVDLLACLDKRRQGLEAMQAADDDDLTHAERASIGPEQFSLSSDRRVTEELLGQIMAHEAGLFLLGDN